MNTLEGTTIYLRALEPDDLDNLYRIENDERLWALSETQIPFSQYALKSYLDNAHRDIYEVKQLRLAICTQSDHSLVGLIDIFDFDPLHLRAGVGILIAQQANRKQGYGRQALELLIAYARTHLQLHQLYANIGANNHPSIQLFEKCGFSQSGIKKDWRRFGQSFTDELFYQYLL
ncbi:MAG: GNAT family N-acetyltransferase [Cytophagaceae bacterium]|nr:GNAT family N-acetyltransferase [Cytophagaceae bacterium]